MVDKLGGTVEAKSSLGQGSEFLVELPNRIASVRVNKFSA
jgi:signal transduction histidine kinase